MVEVMLRAGKALDPSDGARVVVAPGGRVFHRPLVPQVGAVVNACWLHDGGAVVKGDAVRVAVPCSPELVELLAQALLDA